MQNRKAGDAHLRNGPTNQPPVQEQVADAPNLQPGHDQTQLREQPVRLERPEAPRPTEERARHAPAASRERRQQRWVIE